MKTYSLRRASALASNLLVLTLAGCGAPHDGAPPQVEEDIALASEQEALLSSDCTGIRPSAPVPHITETRPYGSDRLCWRGTSDGMGNVALGVIDTLGDSAFWSPTPSAGGPPAGPSMSGLTMYELFPTHGSFQGLSVSPGAGTEMVLKTWTHNGTPLSSTRVDRSAVDSNRQVDISLDRGGGVLVVYGGQSNTGNHFFSLTAQRFFPDGTARSATAPVASTHDVPAWIVGGVGFYRESLVLFDGAVAGLGGEHVAGRWLDPVGNPLTPVFDAGRISGIYGGVLALAPLYDGSMVLQLNGQWVLRIPRRATTSTPAPAWLVSHANTKLEWIRGGRGYGLVPFSGESVSVCRQRISLHAQDGTFCGTATFTVDDSPCVTRELDIGRDGTIIQVSPRSTCAGGPCTCTWRWWPQELR